VVYVVCAVNEDYVVCAVWCVRYVVCVCVVCIWYVC
jgi:hypothetical protein